MYSGPIRSAPGTPDIRVMRALLLGERLDHRRLKVVPGGTTNPIQLARPDGMIAFAFRWGALVMVDATPEQEAGLLADLRDPLSHPLAHTHNGMELLTAL